ncbi:MAG: type IV pilus assembly protein PilM [Candidatus Omnitrophica bacterium]|nr:type IV pilus assembly protein PilM [Candidatus Omnitrophota bacterium]
MKPYGVVRKFFGSKLPSVRQETVGIDIGSYSIKVASVVRDEDKHILSAYNVKRIPTDGAAPGKTEKLVRDALREVDIRPAEVNFSVSGSNVIVRFISLPKMPREQMENAMTFEAERYIPFSVNEVIMDSLILDNSGAGQMNVLLAAAKRDIVHPRIEMLGKLGLGVNIIDISIFAVFNAFLSFNTLADDKGTVFFDLGHSQTDVLISTGSIPRFMRLIQIGGKDVTAAISEDMGVSMEEAEELKLKGDEESGKKTVQSTFAVLDELVKEMQLSFGYFENRYNKGIGDIYCSGGMVYQAGVVEYLQEKLGAQLKVWNPVAGMEVSESLSREAVEAAASRLTASIGLAFRG